MKNPIEAYYKQALSDNKVVELRQLGEGRPVSARFNHLEKLLTAIHCNSEGALYHSLNRPYSKAAGNAWGAKALRNDDIERITRIPFDFDPVRPKDSASTDAELAEAERMAYACVRFLSRMGWPEPVVSCSGNGYHVIYRCAMSCDALALDMMANIYRLMADKFSDQGVKFDRSVRSAGQIFRCYGSCNRKGKNTADRPWRMAEIVAFPPRWEQVTFQQVKALHSALVVHEQAQEASREIVLPDPHMAAFSEGKGDYKTLDIVAWFRAHGSYIGPIEGNKHAVKCPWSQEHSCTNRNDTIIYERDHSWPGFYCHHDSCDGRTIRSVLGHWGDADRFCVSEWRSQGGITRLSNRRR